MHEQLFLGLLKYWSGRQDLNLRPPAPKAGALPSCATSRGSSVNLNPQATQYKWGVSPDRFNERVRVRLVSLE